MNYNTVRKILWAIIGITLIIGAISIYYRVVNGHADTGNGSYMPWGLWVSQYIYFISLSAGAFLISALVYVFGVKRLEPIGRLSLFTALVCLIASILHIWFDLGHSERFWYVYVYSNWSSLLNFMVWCYTIYFLVLLAELYFATKEKVWSILKRVYTPESAARDKRILKILASVGIPLAVFFHGGVGAVFGVLIARPYWHVGLYPILFLIAAIATGAAFLTFIVAYFPSKREDKAGIVRFLGRFCLVFLIIEIIYLFADFFQSLYQGLPQNQAAVNAVLFGPFWWTFWIVQILVGTMVPIILLAHPKLSQNIKVVGLACLIIVLGFSVARMNLVFPAMAVPELEGLLTAFYDPRLTFSYVPSLMEWGLTIGIIGFAGLLFLIGYDKLKLEEK